MIPVTVVKKVGTYCAVTDVLLHFIYSASEYTSIDSIVVLLVIVLFPPAYTRIIALLRTRTSAVEGKKSVPSFCLSVRLSVIQHSHG